MKNFIIALLLLFPQLVNAQGRIFKGTVGSRNVVLCLNFKSNGDVTGWCNYPAQGKNRIKVDGFNVLGQYTIQEWSNTNVIGTFTVTLDDSGRNISGSYFKPSQSDKKLQVKLHFSGNESTSTTQKINDTFYGVKLGCSYNSAIATLSNKGIKYYSQNNEITVLDVNFSGYDFEGLTYEFNAIGCYRVRFITTSSDAITNMEQYANFIDMANKAYGSPFTTEENKQGYKDNKTVCVIRRFFSSEDYLYYFGLTYTMESSVAVAQPNDSIGTESYIQPPTTMTEDDPYDASNDVYDPWLGTLNIDGAVYRTAETKAMLTLEKNGTDTYKGRLIVLVGSQDMDTYRFVDTHGSLDGKVRAKSSGRELLVTLVESESYAGDETNLFDGVFNGNDQIFKIVYDGSSYTTTAIGKMEYFYDGANIYTTK